MKTFKILMALFLISFAAKAQQVGLESVDRSLLLSKGKSIRLNSNDNSKYMKIYNDGTNGVIDVSSGAVSIPDGLDLGTANLNLASSLVFEGSSADSNETTLTVTNPTSDRIITFPDTSMTVSGASVKFCGTTSSCSNTDISSTARVSVGQVPLVSGSPSTVTVTGLGVYGSTTSYACTVTNMTNQANSQLKVVNTSTSSITITGPNTVTDTIAYVCVGN